jgi:CubicO group peptidase (beta-lactamase class C family)
MRSIYQVSVGILLSVCLLVSPIAFAKAHKAPKAPKAYSPPPNIPMTGEVHDPRMAEFDRQMISLMQRWRMKGGASVTIMKDGKILAERGYGWADKDNQQLVYPNSRFRIASASKTFTAVTILHLAQEGKLDLNEPIFNILNDLTPLNNRRLNPQIGQITVMDALQMSSGWFSGGSGHFDPMFGPWPKSVEALLSPELPASCETTTRFMMSMPLRYQPGTHYAYSNLDYCLLGLVVNKVTGSRYGFAGYEQYVRTNLLAPLGIQDMAIGSTQLKYRQPNEVVYYDSASAPVDPTKQSDSFYFPYSTAEILKKNFANGGWVATSRDLATFVQALYHEQILNHKYLGLMQSKPAFVAEVQAREAAKKTAPTKKGKKPVAEPAEKVESYYSMGGIIYWLNGNAYWIQTGSFTGTNALIVTKPNGTTIAVIFNYRPDTYSFLHRFRPELRKVLINNDF